MNQDIILVAGSRTLIVNFQGGLSCLTAPKLGTIMIKESLKCADIADEQVDEVIMGYVC